MTAIRPRPQEHRFLACNHIKGNVIRLGGSESAGNCETAAYLGDMNRPEVVYAVNSMWNAPDRHLEPVPGVEKAGCGKWGYTGGDAVRGLVQE